MSKGFKEDQLALIMDALATALIVAGRDGASWFAKPDLANYSCWVVDRHEDKLWEISPI
jgi:thiamine biosynthesis lipoprotein